MDTGLLLMAAVALSILLLGCTGALSQPEAQQAQNAPAINARTGTNVENATAQPQQPKQHTCALTLNPSTINAGSSTEIGFAVQSEQKVVFTYNCGNDIREISTGGLTSGFRLCQFDAPGSADVWIKADGAICAQKTLIVQQPQAAKTCYINQSSVKRDLINYVYDARVQFTGFSPSDELVWVCDHTTTKHPLGGGGVAMGMPLYSDIYCGFTGRPINDAIEVSIGGVSCGSISTR
ncbi:MAG: hypothetical protein NTX79_04305 [Candidatus Micrarchaeota archaeon]|nr:hypothetical protein [Candidatus Micrarchaeota archaeon]